ncbi:tetratricopeptide repeat protein [bacterium]|nr:MAG: tetratricopeptide repeat protein [bacterium]
MKDKASISKAAQTYVAKGQIDKAIAAWETILDEQPDGNTYNTIGDLYLKKKDKSEAIEAFSKAAGIFKDEGFSLKAIALYKKILHISPLEVDALVNLGELNAEKGLVGNAKENLSSAAEIYLKEGSTERALEIFDKLVELSPADVSLKLKIADLHLEIGLKEEASKGYSSIASYYLEKGEIEKAREYYQKALDCNPQNIPVFIGLSRIEEDAGNIDQAYEHLARASSFAFDSSEFLSHFVRLSMTTGNLENAKQALIKLAELEPSNIVYKKQLGTIYLKEGLHAEAWKELQSYIDETIEQGQWDESLELLENFRDTDPAEVSRRFIKVYKGKDDTQSAIKELKSLADICESKNLNEEALELCKDVIELNPSEEDVLLRIKDLEKKLGIEEPASEVSLEGKSPEELLSIVNTYLSEGLLQEAVSLLERLTENEPDNLAYHEKLKDAYVEAGEKTKAFDECMVIAKIHNRNKNIEGKDSIIAEATKLNPHDPRLAELSKAEEVEVLSEEEAPSPATETTESIDEVLAEADFYAQQGLKDEAVNLYKKILSSDPGNAEVRKKLEALGSVEEPEEEMEVIAEENAEVDSELKDIFHEFKKGIDSELGEQDGESRYDLGIAYKEMGLLDDAIKEFKIAEKDPEKALKSASMLALCYMDKKQYPLAIKEFKRVVEIMSPEDEGYLGARCDLADAYVKNKEYDQALNLYKAILKQDPKFRDVERKVKIIQSMDSNQKQGKEKPKSKKDRVSYI